MAKVATSGPEAVKLGFLRNTDKMTVNRDYLIDDAKNTVLGMNTEGYVAQRPKTEVRVGGRRLKAVFDVALWTMKESHLITEHDVTVSERVAYVLCGGNVNNGTMVSEKYLLDLEREAFLSLAGQPKTQERIAHMLSTGKPLRN
jgi:3-hydroxyacyl-CoA dehydrogenase